MNFTGVPSETVNPRADALVETMRAIGYSPETAIADLIDNSIAARARTIYVRFHWNGPASTVTITDDGDGMTAAELVNAMRPGSANPRDERGEHDLGRFGLGLKTASFSQCRRLTVLSKKAGGTVNYRCWDLDHIAETKSWELLTWLSDEELAHELDAMPHGTIVLWELPDRLAGGLRTDREADRRKFLEMQRRIEWHLEMIFHRFLTGDGNNRLRIFMGDYELKPWDPFLSGNKYRKLLPVEEPIPSIRVAPVVLPHHRDLKGQYDHAGRVKGWSGHQGFYIYRNDRLLLAGDWLGLGSFTRDEHHRLARIAVDIPTHLDHEWQIDIRKARARPPHYLRARLEEIGKLTRASAAEVYKARGQKIQKLTGKTVTPLWEQVIQQGKNCYRLNREHPLLQPLLNDLAGTDAGTRLREALRLIEEAVPIPLMTLTANEQPLQEAQPFESNEKEAFMLMQQIYQTKRKSGSSPDEARSYVSSIDPFHQKPHLLDQLQN
jgi:hypothetical protein